MRKIPVGFKYNKKVSKLHNKYQASYRSFSENLFKHAYSILRKLNMERIYNTFLREEIIIAIL